MTVEAMLDFDVEHHSPMDDPGGPFRFADPYGRTGGDG